MQELTERQRMVLRFIEQQISQNGFPPTIREIGQSLGIKSTNGVNDHLKSLQRKGYIYKEGQKSRTLKVMRSSDGTLIGGKTPTTTNPTMMTTEVPLFLETSKIKPGFSLEEADSVVPFPAQFFFFDRTAPLFAIKVSSTMQFDSDAKEGDWLFIEHAQAATPGSRVLMHTPAGLIMRRHFSRESGPQLPSGMNNQGDSSASKILGIVLGVFRRYE